MTQQEVAALAQNRPFQRLGKGLFLTAWPVTFFCMLSDVRLTNSWPSVAFFSSRANVSSSLPSTGRAWLFEEDMKLIMEMKVEAMETVMGQTEKPRENA